MEKVFLDVYKRQIVGSAGSAYDMGITAIWYVGSNSVGCILFAIVMSPMVYKMGSKLKSITYPELIESRYDTRCHVVTTVTTFLAYIGYTAGQMAAAGNILHVLLGWELTSCLLYTSRCV